MEEDIRGTEDRNYREPTKGIQFTGKTKLLKSANEAWLEVLKIPIENHGTMRSIVVAGRRIDFWPSSDCYYLHSKQTYGYGIAELVKTIKAFSESRNPSNPP